MDFRHYLIEELKKIHGLTEPYVEITYKDNQAEIDAAKAAIESEKRAAESESPSEVSKEEVMNYLLNSGYELTQDNYEQAKAVLQKKNSFLRKIAISGNDPNDSLPEYKRWAEFVDHTDVLSDEQLKTLVELTVARELHNSASRKYEYVIRVVNDLPSGGTNVIALQLVLNEYSNKGYRVAKIFTNEVGKNMASVSVGGFTSGVNATMDQIVIIFEKPINDN